MITNNHVIDKEILENNEKITVSINDDEQEEKKIKLKNKIIYTNEKYDTTIIEINYEDKIYEYLELDNININENHKDKNKISVYILQYPIQLNKQKASNIIWYN